MEPFPQMMNEEKTTEMKRVLTIHSMNEIGNSKKTRQDAVMHTDINQDYLIAAVFDGCSSGRDSEFASILFKHAIRIAVGNLITIDDSFDILSKVVWDLINVLHEIKVTLELDDLDLLSTAIIAVYDKEKNSASTVSFGDGVIICNDMEIVIEQNNQPDYLAYSIDKLVREDYLGIREFLAHFEHTYSFNDISDLIISTDGIQTFKNYANTEEKKEQIIRDMGIDDEELEKRLLPEYPVEFLTRNSEKMRGKEALARKSRQLNYIYHWRHEDDLAMVRLHVDTVETEKEEE